MAGGPNTLREASYRTEQGVANPDGDLRFMMRFAQHYGGYMVAERERAMQSVSLKLDRTVVTTVDTEINSRFIAAVEQRSDGRDAVHGEEASSEAAEIEDGGRIKGWLARRRQDGRKKVWVIDPVDGTGNYIDESLEDEDLTACMGLAQFLGAKLRLSVVRNPFRKEEFVADRDLRATFLNGRRLDLRQTPLGSAKTFMSEMPYDYSHWDGAPLDARSTEDIMGHPPIGSYSAINQACDVARGESAFSIFPGNTVHDIAPGALLVELAGGVVSDPRGEKLDWRNLNGAVYAVNPVVHAAVVECLQAA
jgi:fructose-1,6-bisphosphatase/inositol monophosphatase family enzyme